MGRLKTRTSRPARVPHGPPHLARYPFVNTQDPDVGREAVCEAFMEVMLEPGAAGTFEINANRVAVGPFGLICTEISGCQIEVSAIKDFYVLLVPLQGSALVQYGNQTAAAGGCNGVIVSLQQPSCFQYDQKWTHLALRLPRARVEEHLSALLARQTVAPPRFELILDGSNGKVQSLLRLIQFFASELDRHPSLLEADAVLQRVEDLIITALLTAQPHSYSQVLDAPASAAGVREVREAEAYIEAHCGEPLRMQTVARVVGVSLRGLQLAFQRHRGYSPGQFLRRVRLDHARCLLARGAEGTSVTRVAHACGFLHLGQFAVDYRRRFQERPSDTLHRTRG